MQKTMTCGCAAYGNAALTVEPGLNDSIVFEICDDEGDQLGAVLIDKEHAARLAAHLLELIK